MTHTTPVMFQVKPKIDRCLKLYLMSLRAVYHDHSWSKDALDRIAAFAVRGKSVRGSLVVYAFNLFQKDIPQSVWDTACAIELLHAGLLIHDDIMDRDTIRRGMPTLHSQYEQLAAVQKGSEISHFGLSQAINIADFCYFLGYDLLCSAGSAVMHAVSSELARVTLAQMQDVAGGHLPVAYDKDVVLNLYRYKTARYTFSLPLRVGATLANADAHILVSLERLGECLGLLYQIRDDELNEGGDTEVTGKSVGTDRENGKQTLASLMTPVELEKLRRQQRIDAQTIIRSLPIADDRSRELMALLRFCEERNK